MPLLCAASCHCLHHSLIDPSPSPLDPATTLPTLTHASHPTLSPPSTPPFVIPQKNRHHKKQIWSSDEATNTCHEADTNPLPTSPIRALRASLQQDWQAAADSPNVLVGSPTTSSLRAKPVPGEGLESLLQTGPSWLRHQNQVLRFFIYFKEPVHESQHEAFRSRKCKLLFYLSDNTIQIEEPKCENSGLPQGAFLKRGAVERSPGVLYLPEDFMIGNEVHIFGRVFHVYDCDGYTREYMAERLGVDMGVPETLGADPYDSVLAPKEKNTEVVSILGAKQVRST